MNVFKLMATLGLDKSDYNKGLDEAETEGSKFGSGLKTAGRITAAAIMAASGAVVAFGKSSVDAGLDFDKAMSQVAATMGKTSEEMQSEVGEVDLAWGDFSGNLREYALEMGKNTAFSATQAAEALNYMALAGYDTQTSMEMLPNVLNLAAAGGMDLARASDMVTDTQTAFGLSLERTSLMVDEMAKAASTGNTSVSQLGEAFLVVGGLAQELNGGMITLDDGTEVAVDGIQEMEIALTAMANAGVKGSEAGTHMRNMIMKLSSPTKEGSDAMLGLGLSIFDAEGNMRSLHDIMGDLNTALGDLTQEEKIQAISALFNARDLASAEALLGAVEQDWDAIGASIMEAQGSAQKMADTQLDNLAGDTTLFQSALEGAKITVSDKLTPSLRKFVQFGTSSLGKLTDAFNEGGLKGAMEELGSVLAEGLGEAFEVAPEVVEAAMALLGGLVNGIVENLPMLMQAAIDIIVAIANGISENLPTLIPAIVEGIVLAAQTLVDHLPDILDAVLQIVQGVIQGLLNAIPTLLEALPQFITSVVKFIIDSIPVLIAAVIDIVSAIVQAIPKMIPALILGIVNALPDLIIGIVTGLLSHIPELIEAGFQLFVALIENLPEIIIEIVKAIPKIITSIVNGFKEKFGEIKQVGKDMIEGLWNGISDKATWLWEKVKGWCGQLWGKIKDFFGIHSPSKLFREEFGKNLMLGFAQGIEKYGDYGVDAMEDWVEDINKTADFSNAEMADKAVSKAAGAQGDWHFVQNIYAAKMTPAQAMNEARDAFEIQRFLGLTA